MCRSGLCHYQFQQPRDFRLMTIFHEYRDYEMSWSHRNRGYVTLKGDTRFMRRVKILTFYPVIYPESVTVAKIINRHQRALKKLTVQIEYMVLFFTLEVGYRAIWADEVILFKDIISCTTTRTVILCIHKHQYMKKWYYYEA